MRMRREVRFKYIFEGETTMNEEMLKKLVGGG